MCVYFCDDRSVKVCDNHKNVLVKDRYIYVFPNLTENFSSQKISFSTIFNALQIAATYKLTGFVIKSPLTLE